MGDKTPIEIINQTGFLFQERIEEEIRNSYNQHGWSISGTEHRWAIRSLGEEGFIDIIIQNRTELCKIFIECKRELDKNWVFLVPEPHEEILLARSNWAYKSDQGTLVGWDSFFIKPQSFVSKFCSKHGQNDSDRPMLERICSILTKSIEVVAEEDILLKSKFVGEKWCVYVPAIVTSAHLYACLCKPSDVDINTGLLPQDKAKFVEVPYIRFTKSFWTNDNSYKELSSLKEVNRELERTVFVINSNSVVEFLNNFDLNFTGHYSPEPPWSKRIARLRAYSSWK